ncbi:tetratricopeptide repeat protein [Streptomyces sp. AS02]|uniref:tetratricopeptide repeat protein n=1 Tax=Streptomyces sp. AS02 TaxID=2938946 RepID=UPI0020229B5E|nr:tetratricopeptide repeat protein [Streptomyces sp. AS02]MCL8011391.1 tetratricopeptide repeat protein [Streptomyces sp. AS02]
MQIGVNLFDSGRFSEALRRLTHCVERLSGDALRAELPIALNYLAQLHIAMGDEAEAEAVLLRALRFEEGEEGQQQTQPREGSEQGTISGWHAYNNALLALITSRDSTRAREALRRAADAWVETQQTWLVNLVPIVRNLYVEVLMALGEDTRLAKQLIEDTLSETEMSGMARSRIAAYCLRSRIRLQDGDARDAADDARAALAILADRGPMPALRTEEVWYDASRALTAIGEEAEAAALLEQARAEVVRKADSIEEPRRRERFLTAVPLNRALFPNHRSSGNDDTGTVPEQGEPQAGE